MIELNDETIYWSSRYDWARLHDDGRVEYGTGTFLPPLKVLRDMATQIVKGALYRQRFEVEMRGESEREKYDVWNDLYYGGAKPWQDPLGFEIKVEAKIDYTGHLTWWISGRTVDPDSGFHAGSFMDPSCALAWLIASEWEHHKEWMSEQLEVVGGLA